MSASSSVAPTRLAIIGGSSFLESAAFAASEPLQVKTEQGDVQLRSDKSRSVFFVQRHGANPAQPYSPPHLINYHAIALALQQVGVSSVIAFASVGSLHRTLTPGTLLLPSDFYCPQVNVTLSSYDKKGHCVPVLNKDLRTKCASALTKYNISYVNSGVYGQTVGPRFETGAEVRALGLVADIVGMTCGNEAVLFGELGIPYSIISMIDNYGNGVLEVPLTFEDFHAGVKRNLATMERVLGIILHTFAPTIFAEPALPAASSSAVVTPTTSHTNANHVSASSSSSSSSSSSPSPSPSAAALLPADLMVHARYIVPVDPEGVFENHSLIVKDGVIIDMLPTILATAKYSSAEVRDLSVDHALMPGFVNGHTHVGMTLLRGYSDDLCLADWLRDHIWPAEAVFCSPSFTRDSTELGLAELIRSGTTTINEMYFFPEVIVDVVAAVGIRANIGLISLDFPTNYAKTFDEYMEKGRVLRASLAQQPAAVRDRITFSLMPHAPYTVADEHFSVIATEAKKHGECICTHLHETRAEVVDSSTSTTPTPSRHRSETLARPLHNLHRLGVVNDRLIAVHMTQLNDDDITLLRKTGASVVHCPSSNLKLASGFCPVAKLVDANVNVALGTDSAASNNSLDMFTEMRTASLLAKAVSNDATAVPATSALQMATLNGAQALHLQQRTGSLLVGKAADFIAVTLSDIDMQPLYQIQSHLAYCASRDRVTHSWVAGKALMINRRLTTLDVDGIVAKCKTWTQALMQHKLQHLKSAEHKAAAAAATKSKRKADEDDSQMKQSKLN